MLNLGDADRAGDDGADVRHGRQRHRSVDRHLRRLRLLRHRDLAATTSRCSASLVLLGCVGVYAALGALIYLRNLPSIVVTLGMSFVWQGLAILLLPKPGGKAPGWLQAIMGSSRPSCRFRSSPRSSSRRSAISA